MSLAWKWFPYYWPHVRGIHWCNSKQKISPPTKLTRSDNRIYIYIYANDLSHEFILLYPFFQKNTTYFINREQLLEAIAGFKESISGRVSCNKCSSSEFVGLLKTNQLIRNLFSNSIMPTAVNWYPTKLSDDNDLKEMLANHTFFTSKSGEDGSVSGIGYLGCNPCSVGIGVSAHIWCREMESFKSLLVEMMSYVTMVTQPGTTLVYNSSYSGVEDEDVRAFLATQLGSYYVSKVAVNQGGSYIETPVVRDTSSMTSKLWTTFCAGWNFLDGHIEWLMSLRIKNQQGMLPTLLSSTELSELKCWVNILLNEKPVEYTTHLPILCWLWGWTSGRLKSWNKCKLRKVLDAIRVSIKESSRRTFWLCMVCRFRILVF